MIDHSNRKLEKAGNKSPACSAGILKDSAVGDCDCHHRPSVSDPCSCQAAPRCITKQSCPPGDDPSEEIRRDRELVELCLRGDEDAWEAIIKLYGKRIFNHALRLIASRDEAEDITQEIFIRAFINLRGFRSETGSFRNWLFRVGRNLIIDNYRKKKRLRATMAPDELESLRLEDFRTPNPQHLIELEEAAIFLRKGLMTLSPEIKKALELRDVEGLSYFEIAQVAGVSQGTVKSRISRGRVQLGKFIIKERAHVGSRVSPSS